MPSSPKPDIIYRELELLSKSDQKKYEAFTRTRQEILEKLFLAFREILAGDTRFDEELTTLYDNHLILATQEPFQWVNFSLGFRQAVTYNETFILMINHINDLNNKIHKLVSHHHYHPLSQITHELFNHLGLMPKDKTVEVRYHDWVRERLTEKYGQLPLYVSTKTMREVALDLSSTLRPPSRGEDRAHKHSFFKRF